MPAPWALQHVHELERYHGGRIQTPILDIGCGRGDFLCELVLRGYDVQGVDIDPAKIAVTHQIAADHHVTIRTQQCPAEKLPFPHSTFAFINCSEVIEHVQDPLAVLREIHRVLMSGGRAYISFHNRIGLRDHHYHLIGINWLPRAWADTVCQWLGKTKGPHTVDCQRLSDMHYFFIWRLNKLLRDIGFDFEDVRETKIREVLGPVWMHRVAIGCYRVVRATALHTVHYVVTKI